MVLHDFHGFSWIFMEIDAFSLIFIDFAGFTFFAPRPECTGRVGEGSLGVCFLF